ncbi:hypothetical protein B0T09DRAFT_2212 [Sordaria sp. MPI-SDFR-AT-0083]|nr:hypothetical protein B0T09DRAFT_2212 [Sordaria sp. MPI-SDFR-AT-0083]
MTQVSTLCEFQHAFVAFLTPLSAAQFPLVGMFHLPMQFLVLSNPWVIAAPLAVVVHHISPILPQKCRASLFLVLAPSLRSPSVPPNMWLVNDPGQSAGRTKHFLETLYMCGPDGWPQCSLQR